MALQIIYRSFSRWQNDFSHESPIFSVLLGHVQSVWGRDLQRGVTHSSLLPVASMSVSSPPAAAGDGQERKRAGRGYWSDCPEVLWGCRGNELVASGQCAAADPSTFLFVPVCASGLPPHSPPGSGRGLRPCAALPAKVRGLAIRKTRGVSTCLLLVFSLSCLCLTHF